MTARTDAIHTIGVVAERTGISADVIRVWERRYDAVQPERDDGGRRMYTRADIDRLGLLARATEGGRSIGQVVDLDPETLRELVREDEAARASVAATRRYPADAQELVDTGLRLVRSLDATELENLLVGAAARHGIPTLLRTVVAPMFRAIGDAWHAGELSIAQEHLATVTVRGVLVRLLGNIPQADAAPVLLVATPVGERHEIGVLMVAAEAMTAGWSVVYLGADLPAAEIAAAAVETRARAVAVGAVYGPGPVVLEREIRDLRLALPVDVTLLLGGSAIADIEVPRGNGSVVHVEDLDHLQAELRSLA